MATNLNKVMELLGATKLQKSTQKNIETLLVSLIENRIQADPRSFDNNMTKLLKELGADKLQGDTQKDLTEKLCVIVEVETEKIYKDSLSTEDGKIKKDFFKWDSYSNVPTKSPEKISKDMFQWESSGYGGRIHESSSEMWFGSFSGKKKIFFNRNDKKILFSHHPQMQPPMKLTEADINDAIGQGYVLIPWSTDNPDWKTEMIQKARQ